MKGNNMFQMKNVIVMMCVVLCVSMARGSVTETGSVTPATGLWDSSTYVHIYTGTVTVDGDSDVESNVTYVAEGTTSVAEITVTDPGSTWTLHHNGNIGYKGEATMNIIIQNPAAMECLAMYREGLIETFEMLDTCLRAVTSQTVGVDINGKIVGIDVDDYLKRSLCEKEPETCEDEEEI